MVSSVVIAGGAEWMEEEEGIRGMNVMKKMQ